jgi:hypothetical protein
MFRCVLFSNLYSSVSNSRCGQLSNMHMSDSHFPYFWSFVIGVLPITHFRIFQGTWHLRMQAQSEIAIWMTKLHIYIYICIYIHGMKTNPTKPPKPTKPIPIHFFIFPHTYNIFVFTYFQMFWPTMYAMSRLDRLWYALARSQRSQSRMQVSCLRWWGHRSCLIAVWSRFSKSSTKRWSTICNS